QVDRDDHEDPAVPRLEQACSWPAAQVISPPLPQLGRRRQGHAPRSEDGQHRYAEWSLAHPEEHEEEHAEEEQPRPARESPHRRRDEISPRGEAAPHAHFFTYLSRLDAMCSAVLRANAMIVSCGFTSSEVGKTEPSVTKRPSTSCASSHGSTTPV